MEFFDTYVSNTLAGTGNQSFFAPEGATHTARVFYRAFQPGTFSYAFLFSGTVDSTYADGSHSRVNRVLDAWRILALRVGTAAGCDPEAPLAHTVTFAGRPEAVVAPGAFLASDPITLTVESDRYLVLEMTCAGPELPYHPEAILPIFEKTEAGWIPSPRMPLPGMVGVARPVRRRIGFWGDSITQGIGTPVDSYSHYGAVATRLLGAENAYWDLGIGYARAYDAATGGAWAFKARQNDLVTLCFGVNDIFHRPGGAAEIIGSLEQILADLARAGVRVLVQTVPPFDYDEAHRLIWQTVNDFILGTLPARGVPVFDCVPLLGQGPEAPHRSRYGAHPDAEGHRLWGEALAEKLREMLRDIAE